MSDRASEPLVLREVGGGICTLTLNRPDKHNAVVYVSGAVLSVDGAATPIVV